MSKNKKNSNKYRLQRLETLVAFLLDEHYGTTFLLKQIIQFLEDAELIEKLPTSIKDTIKQKKTSLKVSNSLKTPIKKD
jgi:hypothetical protein